jgi:transglutaminase-like putative cysteine protease
LERYGLLTDVAFLAVTTIVALVGLGTVYSGFTYLAVGLAGLVLGMALALLSARLALPAVTTTGAALIGFVVFAGPIALRHTTIGGVVPTSATLSGLYEGGVQGWRELLTTLPPVPAAGPFLVVPYLCGFVSGLVGLLLARRTGTAAVPGIAPTAVLTASILLGTRVPAALLLQGCLFIVATLAWAALRQQRLHPVEMVGESGQSRLRGAGTMLAVAAVVTVGAAYVPVTLSDRYVLRDHVSPPFDPSAYPSPLSSFRRYEVLQKDSVLFSATGVPAGARIRLAVMDDYDGVVWSVAGGRSSTTASGVFERVGEQIPSRDTGTTAHVSITVSALDGIWLPTVGATTEIQFAGPHRDALASSFRYNRSTDVGVVPNRLSTGDTYTMDVIVPPVPPNDALTNLPTDDVTEPDLTGVPDQVRVAAVDWSGSAGTPAARLDAFVAKLKAGAWSDGTKRRSLAGHGAARLSQFLAADQLVGDSEQYAATLGLLARTLNIPARVVLGVVPPAGWTGGDVKGSMVSAWVEVHFAGVGWVPFDPTPPVTNVPKDDKPKPNPNGDAQLVVPPTVDLQPPAQLPPPDRDHQPGADGPINPPTWWMRLLFALGTYVGIPLGVVALLLGVVIVLKGLRRRRRRRGAAAAQVAGGWSELLDRLRDLGVVLPVTRTRREAATALDEVAPELLTVKARTDAQVLATRANAMIFGPGDPSPEQASAYWDDIGACAKAFGAGRSRWRRLRAVVNPASLGLVLTLPEGLNERLARLGDLRVGDKRLADLRLADLRLADLRQKLGARS